MAKSIEPLTLSRTVGYGDTLLNNMYEMQKEGKFTDFSIKTKSGSIACHRNVLSAGCEYFKTLLGSEMKENVELILEIMDEKVVYDIIQYIYGQAMVVDWQDIKEYLDVAEMFAMTLLKQELEDYICDNVCPDDCLEWYFLADRYQLQHVSTKCKQLMRESFSSVGVSAGFSALGAGEVVEIITDKEIASGSCDAIMKSCINWILADEEERKDSFSSLLSHIDLSRCSPSYLKCVLDDYKNRLICDVDTYATISTAMLNQAMLPGTPKHTADVTTQYVVPKTTNQRSARGPITISECSPDGSYILIENTGRRVSSYSTSPCLMSLLIANLSHIFLFFS